MILSGCVFFLCFALVTEDDNRTRKEAGNRNREMNETLRLSKGTNSNSEVGGVERTLVIRGRGRRNEGGREGDLYAQRQDRTDY